MSSTQRARQAGSWFHRPAEEVQITGRVTETLPPAAPDAAIYVQFWVDNGGSWIELVDPREGSADRIRAGGTVFLTTTPDDLAAEHWQPARRRKTNDEINAALAGQGIHI